MTPSRSVITMPSAIRSTMVRSRLRSDRRRSTGDPLAPCCSAMFRSVAFLRAVARDLLGRRRALNADERMDAGKNPAHVAERLADVHSFAIDRELAQPLVMH